MRIRITATRAFALFTAIAVGVFIQAVWWIVFMAQLIDEKVNMAKELGASDEFIAQVQEQEVTRQIMLGSEGILFLLVIIFGAWLSYRALLETEALKTRQTNFLLSVTHELKTPIASMRIYMDTLQSDKIPTEKKEQILPRMKQDAIRLERMVSNIIEATRIDQQKFLLDLNQIDFSQLVQTAVDDLEGTAKVLPREITTNIQTGLTVKADSKQLKRAVDAVLENSLKYHDGSHIKIDIALTREGKHIRLRVQDEGSGFDPKEAKALFERFYRVGSEMTRATDGTGLGLYLCREIVRAHGGEVTAFSEGYGQGALMTIEMKGINNDENNSAG